MSLTEPPTSLNCPPALRMAFESMRIGLGRFIFDRIGYIAYIHQTGELMPFFLLLVSLVFASPQRIGSPALNFSLKSMNPKVTLKSLGSDELMLSRYVGPVPQVPTSAMVLFFFSSDMGVGLLKPFRKLQNEYSKKGVVFVGVFSDSGQILDGNTLKQLNFPVLHDRFLVVADRYEVVDFPSMYLIDRDGLIYAQSKPTLSSIEKDMQSTLNAILAEDIRKRP